MANNNRFLQRQTSNFVDRETTSVVEPIVLNSQQNRQCVWTTNTIFGIFLFALLIILLAYILFHGKVTDTKLSRLTNNVNSNDMRQLFDEMNRSLKSIELLLMAQAKKSKIDIVLNGKDLQDIHLNQTVLLDFLRTIKEYL